MSDLPSHLDLTSADLSAESRERLAELFPEAIHETGVDFDVLRRALGDWVDPGKERFGLSWPGKAECARVIQQPSIGTLVPAREDSVDYESTENLVVEGDNLEVLKLLQKSYYGKVRMIFIDPPYNTGKEFIYPDNFREGLEDYLRYSGQVDGDGLKLSANTETAGRFHSRWLSMMYPRLFLARNLLTPDGAIFISIDDNEFHHLRLLTNEIFGEENFVASIVWQKKYTRSNDAKWFSANHDYILAFARSLGDLRLNAEPRTEEQLKAYSNPDADPRGDWKATPLHAKSGRDRDFVHTFPNGITWHPPTGTFPRFTHETLERLYATGAIWFGRDGGAIPSRKTYLSEVKEGVTPTTIWTHEFAGHTHEANNDLKVLDMGGAFDNPKPVKLLKRLITLATDKVGGDIVLDFFAGSGTTADAVLQQNRVDGGDRRFILVQLPEATGDPIWPTIADLTMERVRRASAQVARSQPVLGNGHNDQGFRAYALAASNFHVWQGENREPQDVASQLALLADHVVEGRDDEAILAELLLKAGFPLTASVDVLTLDGRKVFSVVHGALLVCLDREITVQLVEAMAAQDPGMILVLDSAFRGEDELKVNAVQTVRARNRNEGSDIVFKVV